MHIPLQDKGAHCRGNTSAGSTLNEFCKNFAKQNSRISASSTTGAVSREGLNHSAWGRAPWLTKTNTIRLPRSARTPSLSSHVFSSRKNARALKKTNKQRPPKANTNSTSYPELPPDKKRKQKCDRPLKTSQTRIHHQNTRIRTYAKRITGKRHQSRANRNRPSSALTLPHAP